MSVDKKHYAIVFPVVAAGIAAPFSSTVAAEKPQTETIDPVPPEPDQTEVATDDTTPIARPQIDFSAALGLFENRDGSIPDDPRLKPVSNGTTVDIPHAMSNGVTEDYDNSIMANPIPSGGFSESRQEFHAASPDIIQSVARIADTALKNILSNELPVNELQQTAATYPVVSNNQTDEMVSQTPNAVTSTASPPSPNRLVVNGNGIELDFPLDSGQQIHIETTPQGLVIKTGNLSETTLQEVPQDSLSDQLNRTETQEPIASNAESNIHKTVNLDRVVEKIKNIAKPAGDGLYYMPDPVMVDGKPTYLFDKNTCNSERRAYPEQIAAIIAITEKYNELVASKYPQYKDTVIDVGDFMSAVHIEHDEDNPAVDLRSRKITSPSGTFDGPAFVPNSPNYDVELTVELLEYVQSLIYRDKPVITYVITKDTDDLSGKTQHLTRYYNDKNLLIFKNDHPEHVHFAFTVYDQIEKVSPGGDYGYPCAISGADFTEANQVSSDNQSVLSLSQALVEHVPTAKPEVTEIQSVSYAQTEPPRSIIVDSPELIEHMREIESSRNSVQPTENTSGSDDVTQRPISGVVLTPQAIANQQISDINSSIDSLMTTEAQTTTVTATTGTVNFTNLRIDSITPSGELARIVNAGTLTDGNRPVSEIVDDLSDYSQRILNSISAYAPLNPYQAAELRQNNSGFSAYFPQLENADRQLSDLEVMARARVAHEIVFGDRYGVDDYSEEKIKSDVERIVAFSNRESLRYPGAVGDYKTEGNNSGSSGLVQILNWDVSIDSQAYEGVRDFDANLDPVQNLVHAFQMVDSNRQSGKSAFADWESGWKDDEGRRRDMEIYEENLSRLRQQGIYNQVENMGLAL
jgi:hypothetical protein